MRAPFLSIALAAGWAALLVHVKADVHTCLMRNQGREGVDRVPDNVVLDAACGFEDPGDDEGCAVVVVDGAASVEVVRYTW